MYRSRHEDGQDLRRLWNFLGIWIAAMVLALAARAAGTSAGSTLTQPLSARPAALGEAFTAASDDVSAVTYNPASLNTLSTKQLSFMYEKGIADDAFGSFQAGIPMGTSALGVSFGYYDAGKIDLFDGINTKSVSAKKDMLLALSGSHQMSGLNLGATVKYFNSNLAEEAKATAYAADFGAQLPVNNRFNLGASLQNIGTKLKYSGGEGDSLPRQARIGAAYKLFPNYGLSALVDGIYSMNDHDVVPALGIESLLGPLALRAGYKGGHTLEQFTFGAGFMFANMSLDYSYGLVKDLDARHRASVSMRFGGHADEKISQVPSSEPQHTVLQIDQQDAQLASLKVPSGRTYNVRVKESLGQIALKNYGDSQAWRKLVAANPQLQGRVEALPGERLVLP